jgi:hypothetical protein
LLNKRNNREQKLEVEKFNKQVEEKKKELGT